MKTSIYMLGDSISIHYGPYLEKFVAEKYLYFRKTDQDTETVGLQTVQNENGGDSSAVRLFMEKMIQAGKLRADLLLLNCGLHDIKTDPKTGRRRVSLEEYQENLRAVLVLCAVQNLPVVWVQTTPCDEAVHNKEGMEFHRYAADRDLYAAAAAEIMSAENIPIIDLYSFTLSLGADLYCDHVHFQEHVREKQAAFIAGWLMRHKT